MAIANFPNGIKPTSMTVTSETQTVVTYSQSFSRQARTRGGQRWKIEYIYPTMTRSQISPLLGFLQAQSGRAGEFKIDPASSLFSNTGDTKLASPLVPVQSYESTSDGGGIVVKRAAGNAVFSSFTDNIEAGTFIKFSNHDKVYMTTQPLDLSSAGTGAAFQSETMTISNNRSVFSPGLSGSMLVTLGAVTGPINANDRTPTTSVPIATLSSDTPTQLAVKIAAGVNAIDGFSAISNGAVVTVSVSSRTGGSANGRKVYVEDVITFIGSGVTGIQAEVDNFSSLGGESTIPLYFNPPLREPIDSTTSILVAPLNSIPFNVSLLEDSWSVQIDELELYNRFTLTFQETF